MTNECKRVSAVLAAQLYSSVIVLSRSASAHEAAHSLCCLITVLSYRPVEFSKNPPHSLSRGTEERRGLRLHFLWLVPLFLGGISFSQSALMEIKNTPCERARPRELCHRQLSKNVWCWLSTSSYSLTVQISDTQLALALSVYFCLPFMMSPKNINRRQNMKDWTPLVLHVIHIVPEMCFGVVEIHVLKRENKACWGCVASLTGTAIQTSLNIDIIFFKIMSGQVAKSSKSSVCIYKYQNTVFQH